MKKRFFCLLLVLLLATPTICSCHGARSSPKFEMPDEFDSETEYEITFWAKNDTNMTQVEIYHRAIEGFEALYPNVKVNLRLYTDYSKIYQDVITNISTNTTPNVCITYPDHIATYMTGQNIVLPLDELMADEKYGLGGSELRFDAPTSDEIVPQFLSEGIINGTQYALPFMRSTEACYVNKTFVEALGFELPETLTWDFVWEVSDAATKKNADGTYAVNGQNVMIPFIYKSTDNMMIQMLRQLGGDYSTDDSDILIFNDQTKKILYTISEHASLGAFSTFKISSYPANFLNAGQCIFAIDSTAGATWMGSDAPLIDISEDNIVDFETVVMPIPQFDTENPQMISQGPSVCIFNKDDPQEVLASWLFAQYLLTNDVQIAYSQTEGYAPVTSKAQSSAEYTDYLSRSGEDNELYYSIKLDATRLLLNNIENTFVTPVFNGSASLRSAAGQLIEDVTKAVSRGKTVDESFMTELFDNMSSLYRLDQISNLGKSTAVEDEPLPTESHVLIITLATLWIGIAAYFVSEKIRLKKLEKSKKALHI